jgi:polygalacturonase
MFPATVVNVRDHGAVADGSTDNTAAFARAIIAANAAGGGTVVVPSGTYVTGAIYLKSNVNLRLDGATLRFSGVASRFPTVLTRYEGIECMNHSPMIYAFGETSIALTGTGTLDAADTSSWNKGSDRAFLDDLVAEGVPPAQRVVPGSGHSMRSAFVEPYKCPNVLIQGITLRNSMFWQPHPTPCQNIVVFGCRMDGNWGAITWGSEQTGGIGNVHACRCTLEGVTKFALSVKSNTPRGGFSQNINLDSFSGTLDHSVIF